MAQSSSRWKKKIQTPPSAGKVMITVLWDCEEVILVEDPTGETVKSDADNRTLTDS